MTVGYINNVFDYFVDLIKFTFKRHSAFVVVVVVVVFLLTNNSVVNSSI